MKLNANDLNRLEKDLTEWVRERCQLIGADQLVLGISGGKDSSVGAAICARAIGKENVHGLLMPSGNDKNLKDAMTLAEDLGINYHIIDIEEIERSMTRTIEETGQGFSTQAKLNLPPRIRMTLLYAYAQSLDRALVVNTSNLSEDYIGYVTIYGDSAGAFAPFGAMTSDEIVQLGLHMGLRKDLVLKTPEDGLTDKTDEEVFGFSYETLNTYIRTGKIEDRETKEKIDKMHKASRFKFEPLPAFRPAYLDE